MIITLKELIYFAFSHKENQIVLDIALELADMSEHSIPNIYRLLELSDKEKVIKEIKDFMHNYMLDKID